MIQTISCSKIATLTLALFLPALLCRAGDKNCTAPKIAQDPKFHPGQVWQYKARTGEEKSVLTILRVESLPKGIIIHIRVDGVRLRNCTGGPEPDKFEHMPFAREAIERSVTKLLHENAEIPDFKAGYDDWRSACGGVYTISVAEAVKVAETTFEQNLGCSAAQH
jgi:hypothetical protein